MKNIILVILFYSLTTEVSSQKCNLYKIVKVDSSAAKRVFVSISEIGNDTISYFQENIGTIIKCIKKSENTLSRIRNISIFTNSNYADYIPFKSSKKARKWTEYYVCEINLESMEYVVFPLRKKGNKILKIIN